MPSNRKIEEGDDNSQENDSLAGFALDDRESDSGESFPSPNISGFTIMPITANPLQSFMDIDPGAGNSNSNKVNNQSSADGNDKSQRIWSEEDELVLLKGVIEYKARKGVDPLAEPVEFHDSIKEALQADVTRKQTIDKIRKLRRRYMDDRAVFSKPHGQACRDLARQIWPSESNGVERTKKKKKRKRLCTDGAPPKIQMNGHCQMNGDCNGEKVEGGGGESRKDEGRNQEDEEEVIFDDYPCLMGSLERGKLWALPDYWKGFLLERIGQIGKEKLTDMEAKWRSLQQAEIRLNLRRVELVQEQAQLALDILKAKGTQD